MDDIDNSTIIDEDPTEASEMPAMTPSPTPNTTYDYDYFIDRLSGDPATEGADPAAKSCSNARSTLLLAFHSDCYNCAAHHCVRAGNCYGCDDTKKAEEYI